MKKLKVRKTMCNQRRSERNRKARGGSVQERTSSEATHAARGEANHAGERLTEPGVRPVSERRALEVDTILMEWAKKLED